MNHSVALKERVEGILRNRSDKNAKQVSGRPTVLIATIDEAIHTGLRDLFQAFPLNTIWLEGVEAAKTMLAKERIAACFCGFWLQDGTYRELVRHIRRGRKKIPVIIVSAPSCPDEYRDYLAAMNIGALDFLCYPYRKSDLERMLWMEPQAQSMRQQAPIVGPDLHAGETA